MRTNKKNSKPARMEVQLPIAEKQKVVKEAEKLGQSVTTYVRRSLQKTIANTK